MKKALALLLTAIIFTVSLTGCGKQNADNVSTDSAEINTASTANEQDDRLFPSIVYDEYNMFERESDELYLKPASDDYILVVQEFRYVGIYFYECA